MYKIIKDSALNLLLDAYREEIAKNILGSQAGETLLHELKPKYWFAAHLHCRFAASVQHNEHQTTEFLALDKCLPKRQFLEVFCILSLFITTTTSIFFSQ